MRPIDAPKFAYNGGKANLRRFIMRFVPPEGSHYVEPFAGRFNMFFLAKVIGGFSTWHLNDMRTKVLYDAILAYEDQPIPEIPEGTLIKDVRMAVDPVVYRLLEPLLCWAGGDYATTTKAVPVPGRDFSAYQANIQRARDLLADVMFTDIDAVDVIRWYGQNEPDAFLYVDPPYIDAQVGAYSVKDVDYDAMLDALVSCRCKWIMSEYENHKTNLKLGQPVQSFYTKVMFQGRTSKTKPKVEVLYSNFELGSPRVIDFQEKEKSPANSRKFFKNHERLTREEVYARWAEAYPNWQKGNFPIEFTNMSKDPWVYYDGQHVLFLEGFER